MARRTCRHRYARAYGVHLNHASSFLYSTKGIVEEGTRDLEGEHGDDGPCVYFVG